MIAAAQDIWLVTRQKYMLTEPESGQVTFGGNTKGKIIRTGKVGKNPSSCIDDVMLVEELAYNLLSIS